MAVAVQAGLALTFAGNCSAQEKLQQRVAAARPNKRSIEVDVVRKHALFREIFTLAEKAEIQDIEKKRAEAESAHREKMRNLELKKAEAEAALAVAKARESDPNFVPSNFD